MNRKLMILKRSTRGLSSLCLLALLTLLGCATPPDAVHRRDVLPGLVIENPYAAVDWAAFEQHRANLHTHTTVSDGRMNPHEVIDRYHALGYTVLALTDHNAVTYPWESLTDLVPSELSQRRVANNEIQSEDLVFENRDPVALGMIAIQGNELSSHHHMGSFLNDHNNTNTEEASLAAIAAKDGLAMLYHPGRYNQPLDWYLDLYRRHEHLFGLEVYNQGDRYPNDRELWDAILSELMPDRPVWGYANDDMHTLGHLARNWTLFLLPELSEAHVRAALLHGHSYYVYAPRGHEGSQPPRIQDIQVDPDRGTIHLVASDYEEIVWISDGRVVHRGPVVSLGTTTNLGAYVRAELHGEDRSVTGTQPFGIRRPRF